MRHIKNIMMIVSAAVLMCSCGIYKKYTRPQDISSDGIFRSETEALSDSTHSLADLSWRQMFTDPFLQRLIDTALVYNADLSVARLQVEQAEASLKSARLAYVPSFTFSPNGAVGSFDYAKAQWTYSVPVAASWQVDIFGGLTSAKRRAKAAYEGSEDYRDAVQTQIIASLANAYYTLLSLDSQLEISRRTTESWGENVETVRLLKDAGMSNEASVSQMEASYYSIQTMVFDLQQQISNVENAISLILGKPCGSIERGKLEDVVLPEELYVGVPVQILSRRPDVRYAERNLMQAYYSTAEARSALYPSLNLSGTVGWTNSVGSAIINPGSLILSAAASLLQPIFMNGTLRARVKIAKASQQQAAVNFRQRVLAAGNEVNDALKQCQTARSKNILYSQQTEALRSAENSTRLLMVHGSSTYLEVLVAQQSLLSAELSVVSNRLAEIQGVVNLYTALGGGVR